jgi:lambda repressor-like predicted transcriptional regulator
MDVKKNPISNERWSWIKFRLTQAGYPTLKSLAPKHKYSISAFTLVKNYAFPSVEKIIADIVGMPPQDVFPNRYSNDGQPIGRNYPREKRLSERKRNRNVKNKRGNKDKEHKK